MAYDGWHALYWLLTGDHLVFMMHIAVTVVCCKMRSSLAQHQSCLVSNQRAVDMHRRFPLSPYGFHVDFIDFGRCITIA